MKNKKAILLKEELDKMQIRYDKLGKKIFKTKKEIQDTCIHNDTEIVDYYRSGNYNDYAYTIRSVICKLCGKELESRITEHEWYG